MAKRPVASRWDLTPALKRAREVADRISTPPASSYSSLEDEIGPEPSLDLPELEGDMQDCSLAPVSPIVIRPKVAVRRITFTDAPAVASTSTTAPVPLKIKLEPAAEVPDASPSLERKPVFSEEVRNELFDVQQIYRRKESTSGVEKELLVLMLRVAHSLERVTLLLSRLEERMDTKL